MRRVLIVSPHFPPTDAVDMHRVRMTVGCYRAAGWEPVVLCVESEDAGRLVDPALLETLPDGIRVVRAPAPARPVHRLLGLNALSFRAAAPLYHAGAALLRDEDFDLVLISTTSFPLMNLGARWKRGFGTPFALDFQDPWATWPDSANPFFRKGIRHGLMRALHRRLERATVPLADGLLATSQTYLDLLTGAYPAVAQKPNLVSPFGFSRQDFEVAERLGKVAPALAQARDAGMITCLFAGRVAPTMQGVLARLFDLVAKGRADGLPFYSRLAFVFVGTGYSGEGEMIASRLAAAAGLADAVTEVPERVSLLDAWKTTLAADILLVLGSDDLGYVPSKLNAILALPKPVICVAPAGSPVARMTADLSTVLTLSPTEDCDPDEAGRRLQALVDGWGDYVGRMAAADAFKSAQCAQRDCGLFDQVMAGLGR